MSQSLTPRSDVFFLSLLLTHLTLVQQALALTFMIRCFPFHAGRRPAQALMPKTLCVRGCGKINVAPVCVSRKDVNSICMCGVGAAGGSGCQCSACAVVVPIPVWVSSHGTGCVSRRTATRRSGPQHWTLVAAPPTFQQLEMCSLWCLDSSVHPLLTTQTPTHCPPLPPPSPDQNTHLPTQPVPLMGTNQYVHTWPRSASEKMH